MNKNGWVKARVFISGISVIIVIGTTLTIGLMKYTDKEIMSHENKPGHLKSEEKFKTFDLVFIDIHNSIKQIREQQIEDHTILKRIDKKFNEMD